MGFRPLHDRVVVRRVEADEKTAAGIIIPDTAKEKPAEGEVVAVGSGARNEKGEITGLDVKAGDRVLFGKWSGTEVKVVRTALDDAVSVAWLLITTEALVAEKPKKEAAPAVPSAAWTSRDSALGDSGFRRVPSPYGRTGRPSAEELQCLALRRPAPERSLLQANRAIAAQFFSPNLLKQRRLVLNHLMPDAHCGVQLEPG